MGGAREGVGAETTAADATTKPCAYGTWVRLKTQTSSDGFEKLMKEGGGILQPSMGWSMERWRAGTRDRARGTSGPMRPGEL